MNLKVQVNGTHNICTEHYKYHYDVCILNIFVNLYFQDNCLELYKLTGLLFSYL